MNEAVVQGKVLSILKSGMWLELRWDRLLLYRQDALLLGGMAGSLDFPAFLTKVGDTAFDSKGVLIIPVVLV